MVGPQEVLSFWLDEVGPEGWYAADDALDAEISQKFGETLEAAREGALGLWLTYPSGTLAYLILTDQFPRNIYRGSGRAFEMDHVALAVAKRAICQKWDVKIDLPARQFFYLPLRHSESLSDQDRSVRLSCERMGGSERDLLHAQAHREVIRQFGRFPYRNAALGRTDTRAEREYVAKGGYGHTLRALQSDAAA